MKILVLNAGSSSLKYQVIDMETEEMLAKGNYERIGQDNSFLTHKVKGVKHKFERQVDNHEEALEFIMSRLFNDNYGVIKSLDELGGIGNRVVHGGEKFKDAVLITDEVIKAIEECSDLAPLHNPNAITGIRACQKVVPDMPMVAVFDTSFHQTIPKERYIYPIPYEYYEKYQVRKYGFHGISHQYVGHRVAELMGKDIKDLKIVSCHLGQGASICAIKDGKSVETTMGLTPLGGLAMGSRSGDLDPSVVTFLMRKEGFTPQEMDDVLNKKSGVFGISRVSLDFRDIETEALSGGSHARLALEIFDYLVAENIAKCAVAMGGVDVITFEAGIGEKSMLDRKHICEQLGAFGVEIDNYKNQSKGDEKEISTPESKVIVYVVPTNEELMIARETMKVIEGGKK